MVVEFRGRRYACVCASDVVRDGMELELSDVSEPETILVLSAFDSDQTHEMIFSAYRTELPFEMVEWFIQQARERLPPVSKTEL